jgi:D-alanyl-lipoteichoic acid acyltransferase DltB (MBOAT superfamily)
MSFASYPFILAFLPVALLVARALGRLGTRAVVAGVVLTSLMFYGWSDPRLIVLLVTSAMLNYVVGASLARRMEGDGRGVVAVLAAGVTADVGVLAYFKVTALSTAGAAPGLAFAAALPLGISFFTFQQVKYLLDVYRGDPPARTVLDYVLFVTFFPKLIAGPLVPHADFFAGVESGRLQGRVSDVAEGLTRFAAGLAKKVVLADSLAPHVDAVFAAASRGEAIAVADAWAGALGYALQLYFDFSGYSDMAIGIARMFGVRLPVNFDAPYRAASMIDFWKRWHITLSALFFELVYVPIVMAAPRVAVVPYGALVLTMLVCGAWHGLDGTFLTWALLHALFLVTNHAWRAWRRPTRGARARPGWTARLAARALTFGAVLVAWVFFRAPDVWSGLRVLAAMAGWFTVPPTIAAAAAGWIVVGLAVVWLLPTTQAWIDGARDDSPLTWFRWQPSARWAVGVGSLAALCLLFLLSRRADFIYFGF